MTIFKTSRLMLLIASSLALSAPAQAETTLTLATGDVVGSVVNQVGNFVKDKINSAGGSLKIKHIEGPVLGNAAQIRDQVSEGSVDIFGNDAAWITPYSEVLKTTSFAFIFADDQHLQKFFNSEMMDTIREDIATKYGVRIFGGTALPSRTYFTKKQMQSADDFKNLKIRSPQLDNWLASFKSVGVNPVPVNWNETYLAIQTGLVEGGYGLPAEILPNNWYQVAPYITDLDDMFSVKVWIFNEAKWLSLTDDERKQLTDAFAEADAWLKSQGAEEGYTAIAKMVQDGGGTYTTGNEAKRKIVADLVGEDKVKPFADAERQKMRESALAAARELEGKEGWWPAGTIDQIQAIE